MVDIISTIRQMMAESKFSEALKTAEAQLYAHSDVPRKILLPLFLELLELQDKQLPHELIIETAELIIDEDIDAAATWLEKLPTKPWAQFFQRIQLLKIKIAERKGRLDELYQLISELKLRLYESRVPAKIDYIDGLVSKYFKGDFKLKLQELAFGLMLSDLARAEVQVGELISSCIERASVKGTREKLLSIVEVLKTHREKKQLEIYQSYCTIAALGVSEKSDYKKVAEMIIYFDEFRFQILVLDLLVKLGLDEAAADYALDVRGNKKYDFVYIEKYFGHLKTFFAKGGRTPNPKPQQSELDSALGEPMEPLPKLESTPVAKEPESEEEGLLLGSLKYQDHSGAELLELAVGFMQLNFFRAAAEAAKLAIAKAVSNKDMLKASYIRAISLYHLADYRAAVDLSYEALDRAEDKNDVLSFLYLQAEALARLGNRKAAQRTFQKVLSIDSQYRLARERLEGLNEV